MSKSEDESSISGSTKAGHMRHIVALLAMMGMFMQYCQKIDLSVNLVCMTGSKNASYTARYNRSVLMCPELVTKAAPKKPTIGEFDWSANVKSHLLSAFFYGYLVTEIPAGMLASRFGPKWVMAAAIFINCVCNCLYTVAARTHYMFLIMLRVIVGAGCGCLFPAVSQIWSTWAPTPERSFLVSLATSGAHLGTIMTLPLGGYLCTGNFAGGWPGLFYAIAIMGLGWVVIWSIAFSNHPNDNRFIGTKEKIYIAQYIGKQAEDHSDIPWKHILTSKHCWGMFCCHTLMNWGFYTLLTQTPTYMSSELLFDIKSNGALSALPYISVWLVICVSSYTADYLLRKGYVSSRTKLRKTAVLIGSVIPALCLVMLGFVNCQKKMLAVLLLTVAQGIYGIAWGAGFMVNANDLAPSIAGVIFGISNMFATLPGIIVPHVAAALTKETNNIPIEWQWRTVFILSAGIWIAGGLVFLVLGSGEVEPWADKPLEIPATADPDDEKAAMRSPALI